MQHRRQPEATSPRGWIYLLWAEGTSVFKIGFTQRSVNERAVVIEANSPLPLRIVAEREGSRYEESGLHLALRAFHSHGEWFDLPEAVAWSVLERFGVDVPPGVERATLAIV